MVYLEFVCDQHVFLIISRFIYNKMIWLLISLGLYIINLFVSPFYFDKLMENSIFFVLGIFLWGYFSIIKKWIENKGLLMLIFILVNGGIVMFIGNNKSTELLTALIGSIPVLYLAIHIQAQGGYPKKILELASNYSYGII